MAWRGWRFLLLETRGPAAGGIINGTRGLDSFKIKTFCSILMAILMAKTFGNERNQSVYSVIQRITERTTYTNSLHDSKIEEERLSSRKC